MNPEREPSTLLAHPLRQFLEGDPSFRLNRLAGMLNKTEIVQNESTWVSSTKREEDGSNTISVGTQALPEGVSDRWGYGTSEPSEQLVIKLAHELAHGYQRESGLEEALVSFLNGSTDIANEHIPFIELYAMLTGLGRINGLTTEEIYAEQSKGTGLLKMEILEDITELMAAYMISDEYFTFRLENSVSNLTHEEKEQIATKILQICAALDVN